MVMPPFLPPLESVPVLDLLSCLRQSALITGLTLLAAQGHEFLQCFLVYLGCLEKTSVQRSSWESVTHLAIASAPHCCTWSTGLRFPSLWEPGPSPNHGAHAHLCTWGYSPMCSTWCRNTVEPSPELICCSSANKDSHSFPHAPQ